MCPGCQHSDSDRIADLDTRIYLSVCVDTRAPSTSKAMPVIAAVQYLLEARVLSITGADQLALVLFKIGQQTDWYKTVLCSESCLEGAADCILSSLKQEKNSGLVCTKFIRKVSQLLGLGHFSTQWTTVYGHAYRVEAAAQTYVCCFQLPGKFHLWSTTLGHCRHTAAVQALLDQVDRERTAEVMYKRKHDDRASRFFDQTPFSLHRF